jgi:aromatic ring-opening dioxygenase LigB subunit
MPERPSLLIPAVDEVPRISDTERADLRASLEKASADIASGAFDVVTPQSLRSEFDAIYSDGKSDADIDASLAERGAHHS